jgi:hypothetical protein
MNGLVAAPPIFDLSLSAVPSDGSDAIIHSIQTHHNYEEYYLLELTLYNPLKVN